MLTFSRLVLLLCLVTSRMGAASSSMVLVKPKLEGGPACRSDLVRREFGSCGKGHGFKTAGQLTTTVIGLDTVLPMGAEIKNRWPSADTT
jgi:hypothetical protein